MFSAITNLWRDLPAIELAQSELAKAQAALLQAETAKEYYAAQCAYNEARIKRLQAYVSGAAQGRAFLPSPFERTR